MTDTLNAPALPADIALIITALECSRPTHAHYPEPVERHAAALTAARALATLTSAPAGWKLVPIEPTAEMVEAAGKTPGMRAIDSASATHQLRGYPLPVEAFADGSALHQAYRAMLSAAPSSQKATS